jgi:hypothetical protein
MLARRLLFRAVAARHVDNALFVPARHADAPRIAAYFAILDERAAHVRLDIDLYLLTAEGTRDRELV